MAVCQSKRLHIFVCCEFSHSSLSLTGPSHTSVQFFLADHLSIINREILYLHGHSFQPLLHPLYITMIDHSFAHQVLNGLAYVMTVQVQGMGYSGMYTFFLHLPCSTPMASIRITKQQKYININNQNCKLEGQVAFICTKESRMTHNRSNTKEVEG